MNLYQKAGIAGFLLFFCVFTGFGADFGVVVSADPDYNSSLEKSFAVTGSISPWVSTLFSPTLSLHVSASVHKEYRQDQDPVFQDGFPFLVELDRTELAWRPLPAVYLQFGRQPFGDDAGLIVSGSFDGFHGAFALGSNRLSLGALYTGLLYKKTANIMTAADPKFSTEPDYNDLTTYFATRRILVPISVEFPGLTESSSLAVNGIAQFDMNSLGKEDPPPVDLHSQYLELHYTMEPLDTLHLALNASAGIIEAKSSGSAWDWQTGFAASAGADWELSTAVQDLLSLQLYWSNGEVNDSIAPYFPVSGISVGEIFTPRLSGMMYVQTSYTARPYRVLSAKGGLGYFIRTDLKTFQDAELDPLSDSRLLGGELYCSLVWAPQSAIMITARGGAFVPGLGKAFVSDKDVVVKASIGAMVSF